MVEVGHYVIYMSNNQLQMGLVLGFDSNDVMRVRNLFTGFNVKCRTYRAFSLSDAQRIIENYERKEKQCKKDVD